MSALPILATKLYIPPPRPEVVLRLRLVKRLNEGLRQNSGFGRKLSLIAAPAGFGKTTLVAEWVAGWQRLEPEVRVAWLSLDESDNDPSRFWTYVVAALQTVDAGMGAGALNLLQSPQALPAELFLTSLINEVAQAPQAIILVLDDYHVIETRTIHDALTFLLDHLPRRLHLAVASRADPPLPIARLRGRGELTELRAADLRFTPDEAAAFLNEVMGLDLSAEDVAALETRTEGWIAGLQMAALALQSLTMKQRPTGQGPLPRQRQLDTAGFIRAFTGSHHFIIDYLVEEVLQRQPDHVRSFLLQTSILDRLTGPLCEAVGSFGTHGFGVAGTPTCHVDGGEMLADLERGNLFVVPLDDRRQWYRYHHLFADVLQARLMKQHPDKVPLLHRRASEWYEQNNLPSDAIRHALAAADFERAARLIELAWPAMRRTRQEATVLGWIKALPDELLHARPVLSVVSAWALLDGGKYEAAETRLRDAEAWLDQKADRRETVVVDDAQFRSLPASIANARAYRAQALGDVAGTVRYARQALDLMPQDDYYERGTTAALLGLAYWASGDLEAAQQSFADGLATLQKGGGILILMGGTVILATIRRAQGRLREAIKTYEDALQLATAHVEPVLQGAAELYMGLSELHHEQGDLAAARELLLQGKVLSEQASLPGYEYLWCAVQAQIKEAEGDLDGALDLLDEAQRLYYTSPIPDVRPIAAMKARVWVAQGRIADALAWVRARGLSSTGDLSYLREFEHVTVARVLIARARRARDAGAIDEAIELLQRLLRAAEAGERTGSVIEILVLLAMAHQARGDLPAALVPLERALALAEPEGFVRIFVGEGAPMAQLLRDAAAGGIRSDYAARMLAALEAGELASEDRGPLPASRSLQPLTEPLTPRELDVLHLLRTELSGPEIARELGIALSTIRTHTKSIYSKLNVDNRRSAVKRAAELDLV